MELIITNRNELKEIISETISEVISVSKRPEKRYQQYVYGISGLAELMGCSRVTAQRWKDSGRIPYTQVGRKIVFEVDAVFAALKDPK